MKKVIKVLLIISGITLILVALIVNTFPEWLIIPGGLFFLLGVFFNAVLDAGSKIKGWVDLLFVKEKNDPGPKAQSNYGEIRQQGGPNIIATSIDHLEVHNSPPSVNFLPEINNLKSKQKDALSSAATDAKIDFELFPRYFDGYASIKVHNRESDDINDCILSLLNAKRIIGKKAESMLDRINPDSAYISWGGGNTKKGTIIGKSVATFNLAMHNKDNFLFLLDNGSQQPIAPGLYKLKVAIDGKINGKKIKRKTKTCFFEYRVEEKPVQDGDKIKCPVQKVSYIDIRTKKESVKDIKPSQVWYLDMNASIRFIAQYVKNQQAQKQS